MRQLEKEKQKKEHILVCLSSSPSNEKIIRTAAQMAQAFQAGFTALYVQTAEKTEKTPEDQAQDPSDARSTPFADENSPASSCSFQ